jgi:hypothetical protein
VRLYWWKVDGRLFGGDTTFCTTKERMAECRLTLKSKAIASMIREWFDDLVLLSWALVAFSLYRRLSATQATLWIVLGAQMFLPVGVMMKFGILPQLDKGTIPNFCVLFGCMFIQRRRFQLWNQFGLVEVLILMYLVGPLISAELNGDTMVMGDLVLPGVGLYDGLSAVEAAFIFAIPFFIGRYFLRGSSDGAEIMHTLVVAGLIYSIPILFEIGFSPQLHFWIYGQYSHDPVQALRGGGYRPLVFMGNGLLASFFMMSTAVAAAALWRTKVRIAMLSSASVTAYLDIVLLLCKSLGAIVYCLILTPLIRFGTARTQTRFAVALVVVALSYPALRFYGLMPTTLIIDAGRLVSEERGGSMGFRFENEELLLNRMSERPIFGWGRYGRGRVYDAESGKDISITDGRWIVTMCSSGIFGFIAEFGLLAIGVFRAAVALKFVHSASERLYLAALALIVAVNIVDLLPNSTLTPWTMLLSGALLGRAEMIRVLAQRRGGFQLNPVVTT